MYIFLFLLLVVELLTGSVPIILTIPKLSVGDLNLLAVIMAFCRTQYLVPLISAFISCPLARWVLISSFPFLLTTHKSDTSAALPSFFDTVGITFISYLIRTQHFFSGVLKINPEYTKVFLIDAPSIVAQFFSFLKLGRVFPHLFRMCQ